MLRIRNLSLPVDGTVDDLKKAAARALGVKPGALERFAIARQSIDARKKQDVRCIYTVDVSLPDEGRILLRPGKIEAWEPLPYRFPLKKRTSSLPPVVVGMGPAGLFADCPASCWSGARMWIPGPAMWSGSGRRGF